MAVYVDDMYRYQIGAFRVGVRTMKMSHLIADSDEELHAMAAKIGVARRWWQSPTPRRGSHYDIALGKRSLALQAGAIAITYRQCGAMNFRRRVTGNLGRPEDAERWAHAHHGQEKCAGAGNEDIEPRPTCAS